MPTVDNPHHLAFSPDGLLVAGANENGEADVYAWSRGELVRSVGPLGPGYLLDHLQPTGSGELWASDRMGGVWHAPVGTPGWKRLLGGAPTRPKAFALCILGPGRAAVARDTELVVVAVGKGKVASAGLAGPIAHVRQVHDEIRVAVHGPSGLSIRTFDAGLRSPRLLGDLQLPQPNLEFLRLLGDGRVVAVSCTKLPRGSGWRDQTWSLHGPDGEPIASHALDTPPGGHLTAQSAVGSTLLLSVFDPRQSELVPMRVWSWERVVHLHPVLSGTLDPSGRFVAVTPDWPRNKCVVDIEDKRVEFLFGRVDPKADCADLIQIDGVEATSNPREAGKRGPVRAVKAAPSTPKPRKPVAIPKRKRGPAFDWGCLYVATPKDSALSSEALVREAVIAVYRDAGTELVPWSVPSDLFDPGVLTGSVAELEERSGPTLGDDEVFVVAETFAWCAVMSQRFEWAPLLGHPLALALSKRVPVLSVRSVAKAYTAYERYVDGEVRALTVLGPKPPAGLPALPDIDVHELADAGGLTGREVASLLCEPEQAVQKTVGDLIGHRNAFEAAPLYDYTPGDFLVFRRRFKGV